MCRSCKSSQPTLCWASSPAAAQPWGGSNLPASATRGSSDLTLPSCLVGHTNLLPGPKFKLILARSYSRAASRLPEESRCFPCGALRGRKAPLRGGEEMARGAAGWLSTEARFGCERLFKDKSVSRPFPAARASKNRQDWKEESRPGCGGWRSNAFISIPLSADSALCSPRSALCPLLLCCAAPPLCANPNGSFVHGRGAPHGRARRAAHGSTAVWDGGKAQSRAGLGAGTETAPSWQRAGSCLTFIAAAATPEGRTKSGLAQQHSGSDRSPPALWAAAALFTLPSNNRRLPPTHIRLSQRGRRCSEPRVALSHSRRWDSAEPHSAVSSRHGAALPLLCERLWIVSSSQTALTAKCFSGNSSSRSTPGLLCSSCRCWQRRPREPRFAASIPPPAVGARLLQPPPPPGKPFPALLGKTRLLSLRSAAQHRPVLPVWHFHALIQSLLQCQGENEGCEWRQVRGSFR